MEDVEAKCRKLLDFAPPEEVDSYAEKQLKKAILDYAGKKTARLANVKYRVNGKYYDSLLDAFYEVEIPKIIDLEFVKPDLDQSWDYNTPTVLLKCATKGLGWVKVFDYNPKSIQKWDFKQSLGKEKVMVRAYISNFYFPESIRTHSKDYLVEKPRPYIPILSLFEELWADVRGGIVPIELEVLVYTQHSRYHYTLDLLSNRLLKDFRGGVVPIRKFVEKSALDYFYFDKVAASEDMPELARKAFHILFDSESLVPSDLAHYFGIPENMARNHIKGLARRGFVEVRGKPPAEYYVADLERIKEKAESY